MADLALMLLVFVLSFVIGYVLISRVPPLLHTPLMSMTNAISAVTILGALLLFSVAMSTGDKAIGALALGTAAFNLVGGFVITDRMTRLFKTHQEPRIERRARLVMTRADPDGLIPCLTLTVDSLDASRGAHHV